MSVCDTLKFRINQTCRGTDKNSSLRCLSNRLHEPQLETLSLTIPFNPQEDANRGKPNWEHLSDDLHVLITVEDSENRARMKLARAVEEVQKLLVPVSFRCHRYILLPFDHPPTTTNAQFIASFSQQAEGEDELKKRQLMELAIINGTYRDSSSKASSGEYLPRRLTL